MIARINVAPTIPDTRATIKQQYFNSLGLKSKILEVTLIDDMSSFKI